MRISVIITALLILIIVTASGCISDSEPGTEKPATAGTPASTASQVPPGGSSETKENSEAGVTITAVYLGNNTFDIKLDTHSVSLDYEMEKISYVRDSKGNTIKPESWDGGIGGHHFGGTLKFPKERIFKW